ncbi:MAG: SPOR domain-containing protein [Bacteroidales bacterium]|nr:SPOR domain-containing protein [Bacteroidales bacterium]
MKLFLTFGLILFSLYNHAQPIIINQLKQNEPGWGTVILQSQADIETIIDKHISVNQKAKGIPGYRIQVYFGSGNDAKNQANKIRTELRNAFPSFEAYLTYEEPFFKVKIGDFRNKVEAYKLFKIIQQSYPSAFIVEDIVSYENLP